MALQNYNCSDDFGIEIGSNYSDLDACRIYQEIDENSNSFEIEHAGEKITCLGVEFGNLLFEIERLMQEIREGKGASLEKKRKNGEVRASILARYLPMMNALVGLHSLSKIYSPSIALFFDVCITKYGLMPGDFCGNPDAYSPFFQMTQGEFFNKLAGEFYAEMSQRWFKRKMYARDEAIERGRRSGEEYIEGLFEKWSRLLVIRIDFGFHSARPLMPHATSLNEAQEHLSRFFNNKRGKRLYASLVGYIWRLEFGKEKGYHYHLIFFFDGSKVHKDEYIANKIGEDWIKVTDGNGIYYNCNAHKQKYKRLGIGMISHDDIVKRQNLLGALAYMYKEEQTLREKHLTKARSWGRGVLPKARRSGAGRPRRSQVNETPRPKMGSTFSRLITACDRGMSQGG